jgi:molybdenum cofactor guanylyltransferase
MDLMIVEPGNISGVILAGGENRRFEGNIKAKSLVGGKRIIDRVLNITGKIFDEIIIVTNTPEEFSDLKGCKIVGDYFKGAGPLGGIHSGIVNSSKEAVFIFAGDMPFLSHKMIMRQIGIYYRMSSDAVIPEWDRGIEPLHAIYRRSLADKLEEHLNSSNDYNIRVFLNRIDYTLYKPKVTKEVIRAFTNINTPLDAKNANQYNK